MSQKTDAEILKAIFRYGSRTKTINVPMGAVEKVYEELEHHVVDGTLYQEYCEVMLNSGDILRIQGV